MTGRWKLEMLTLDPRASEYIEMLREYERLIISYFAVPIAYLEGAAMSPDEEMIHKDLSGELWREYEFGPEHERVVYTIHNPKELIYRRNGTTHTVVDPEGVAHTVPTVGLHGCVLRWKNKPEVGSAREF